MTVSKEHSAEHIPLPCYIDISAMLFPVSNGYGHVNEVSCFRPFYQLSHSELWPVVCETKQFQIQCGDACDCLVSRMCFIDL